GAVIGGDDGLGAFDMLGRFEHRQRLDIVPAIIKAFAALLFEAPAAIALRAPAANTVGLKQLAPRQIGVAAAAEHFQSFERGGLIKGHETSPAGRAAVESSLQHVIKEIAVL